MEWLKDRWYWVVGGVVALWVLMRMLSTNTSAGASVSTPSGTSIVYGGTNANDAAVQVAQLQQQSSLAGQQIAANQAVQMGAYALAAAKDTNTANVSIAGIGANRDVAIAQYTTSANMIMNQSNNAAAVSMNRDNVNGAVSINANNNAANVAGLQLTTNRDITVNANNNATNAAIYANNNATNLAANYNNNATNLSIAQINARYGLDITNSNNAASMHISDNATLLGINTNETGLAAVANSNAAKLAAYGIQAQTVNNQTNALRDVAINASNNNASVQNNAINTTGSIAKQQLDNQLDLQARTYLLEVSGALNKGGAGGANQLAAWDALINPSSAGVNTAAAAQVASTEASSYASIINSLTNGIGTALRAFA